MTVKLTEITGREVQSGRGDALDALVEFTKPSTRAISMDLRPIGSGETYPAWTTRWAASGAVGSPSVKAI